MKKYSLALIAAVSLLVIPAKAEVITITFEATVGAVNDPSNLSSFFAQQYEVGETVAGSFTFPSNVTVLSSDSVGIESGTDYFLAGDAATAQFNLGGDTLSANGAGSAISIQNDSSSGLVGDVYAFSNAVNSNLDDALGFIGLALVDSSGTLFDNEDFFELESLDGFDFGFLFVGGQFGAFDALDREVLNIFANGLVDLESIQLTSVPEPSSLGLLLLAFCLVGLRLIRFENLKSQRT